MDTKELLNRYKNREIDFVEVSLHTANLKGANLRGANLERVYLYDDWKEVPLVLGNVIVLEVDETKIWHSIKKWTRLTKLSKALYL